jgi:hypothetical protein
MSSDSRSASVSMSRSIRSARRSRTRLRSVGLRRDQTPDSKAARAAATAVFTSSAEQSATSFSTTPVAGLVLAKVLPVAAERKSPAMKARPSGTKAAARAVQSCSVSMAIAPLPRLFDITNVIKTPDA